MGLFKRIGALFKKNIREEDRDLESMGADEPLTDEAELTHHMSQIIDATYEMEDLKREYELVTSYFTDIQRIEQMPDGQRFVLEDDARKILMLEESRRTLKETPRRVPSDKYQLLTRLEPEIPDAIEEMKELESMRGKIKRDLEYLEGEKGALEYQEEDLKEKQLTIRRAAIVLGTLAALSIVTFLWINIQFGADLIAAGAIIAIIVLIIEFFLVMNHSRIEGERKLAYRKHNRAIVLQNKVKIKWLNNTNHLDYLYAKYEVNSRKELAYNWEQYQLMREEERKLRQSTGDLKVYQEEIISNLQRAGVNDCMVWLQQVVAFVDKREMVEVKHSLNVRRQRLREQMQQNEETRQNSLVCVKAILTEHPELKGQAREVLTAYHIAV
ncbi:MAG: hypothetical protein IJ648_04620 [Lachnospiraceae bacterium]|nr:hypothetical protein [Lachnospiraceae bacterium]